MMHQTEIVHFCRKVVTFDRRILDVCLVKISWCSHESSQSFHDLMRWDAWSNSSHRMRSMMKQVVRSPAMTDDDLAMTRAMTHYLIGNIMTQDARCLEGSTFWETIWWQCDLASQTWSPTRLAVCGVWWGALAVENMKCPNCGVWDFTYYLSRFSQNESLLFKCTSFTRCRLQCWFLVKTDRRKTLRNHSYLHIMTTLSLSISLSLAL